MKTWIVNLFSKMFLGDYLGSVVRHAMTVLGGFLIAKGLATEEAVANAMPQIIELVMGIITAAVAQGLSFANKKTK